MPNISSFKSYCNKRVNEQVEVNKLVVYDFDGTLFHSPEPEEGKKLYQDLTGAEWPYKGWWGRVETLSPPLVPEVPGPEWYILKTVSKCKADLADAKTSVVLMTGRPSHFRRRVENILHLAGLEMDGYFFSGQPGAQGASTFEVKWNFISRLLNPNYRNLEIHEDRPDQIEKFKAFAPELKSKFPNLQNIVINDVPNDVQHHH